MWESCAPSRPATNATRTARTRTTTLGSSSRPNPSPLRLLRESKHQFSVITNTNITTTTSIISTISTASARIWPGASSIATILIPINRLHALKADLLQGRLRTLQLSPNCGRWRRLLPRIKSSNISNSIWGSLGNQIAPPPAVASLLPPRLPPLPRLPVPPPSTRPTPSLEDLFITLLPFIAITQTMATSAPCRAKGSCGTLIHLE